MFYQFLTNLALMLESVRALLIALAFLILTLAAQQVGAATVTVTSTTDSGAGSLRQAVADANATPDADTVNFNVPLTDSNCDSSGVCTITLTGGVITVQAAGGALTIANQTGAGNLLISGNNASRIFEVGRGGNLTLDGLTVTRGVSPGFTTGNAFGVVRNAHGTLTIMNSVFTENTGGCVIATEAFGPFGPSDGILNVINTTVSNNTATGIFVTNSITSGGTLNVVNSTISNNTAPRGEGGIYFLGDQLRVTNSTISGNKGSIGGINVVTVGASPSKSFVLTNCTITGNIGNDAGGGIEVYQATLNLRNTIVSGNTNARGASDVRFYNASGKSLGHNLIGTSTNFEFGFGEWLASDMLNQDARLAPLGNNGGATLTHALLPDSPAINRGDNTSAPATDQRGYARIVGGTIDIGAFEFAPSKSRKRVRLF